MTVIEHPHVTEKAVDKMDFENKMQFIVDIDANKGEIAEDIAAQYDVTVENVTTMVTPQGKKKATVLLSEDDDAQEIASRIGVF
ncbi:50S ribosomal protein L23 [Salinibaculum rarum]|uniref:50S ribosomal protein L23 n=1 Tax=Salinibaculum rarum TaxID=3058903 RepID=UPI00265E22C4|nr:50S ribosomal protein L23 [Salinibaculum sp. KK48]